MENSVISIILSALSVVVSYGLYMNVILRINQ